MKISATISSFGHQKFTHKLLFFFVRFDVCIVIVFFWKLYLSLHGICGEQTYVCFFLYFVFQIIVYFSRCYFLLIMSRNYDLHTK